MAICIQEIPYTDTYPLRHKVMYPNKDLNYVQLPKDPEGRHLGLFLDQELISVISLFREKDSMQFRKFATLEQHQGKGYGTQLLQYVIDYSIEQLCTKLWCNARVEKIYFYKNFMFKETDEHFTKGEIEFIIIEKNLLVEDS